MWMLFTVSLPFCELILQVLESFLLNPKNRDKEWVESHWVIFDGTRLKDFSSLSFIVYWTKDSHMAASYCKYSRKKVILSFCQVHIYQ